MFLLDSIWKATVLLAVAGLAGLFLRHAAAGVRHMVWIAALAGVLALPFVSPLLPRHTVPIEAPAAVLLTVNAAMPAPPTTGRPPAAMPAPKSPVPVRSLPLGFLWAAGALLVAMQFLLGWAVSLRRRAKAR